MINKEIIGIIGFGRFGKVLHRLLKDEFEIIVFDPSKGSFNGISGFTGVNNVEEVFRRCKTLFYAVPISKFETVVTSHKKYFDNHLLIDVLSVKVHPAQVFQKVLRNSSTRALLTHPMFGPDSSKDGFNGLPIVIDNLSATAKEYSFWKNVFNAQGLRIVELSPDEHDLLAAKSQGTTHFIGRLLESINFKKTPIDTNGAKKLLEVMDLTIHDTWELFSNLQTYNPYTKEMRIKLGNAYDELYNSLLPKRISKDYLVFGIQGGKGSFNEQALSTYVEKEQITNYKVKYLYTTDKVLAELRKGTIDFGQFAIENSVGGLVSESIHAMAKYKFTIVDEFSIRIAHFLMKRKDASRDSIKEIMAHPQVLKQCRSTLAKMYSKYTLKSGSGKLIDTAEAARALANGKLAKTTAILGPQILSELYDFDVIAENLQDDKTNNTSFLIVKR